MSAAVGFLIDQGIVSPSVQLEGAKAHEQMGLARSGRRDSCAELMTQQLFRNGNR
jgi:hypothetical protein